MLSQVGFPSELKNEIDYQLPPNVSSYNVKIVPSNASSFATATQTLTASATQQLNGGNQNIIFDIPASQGKSVFIDPRFTTLNFRVNYEIVNTDASNCIVTTCQLRSSAYAHFDRCYTQSQSGVLLDDVNLVGLVQDALINLEIDVAQRDALALMYGFNFEGAGATSQNNNQGHKIAGINNTTIGPGAKSKFYSYSMPLLNSLIGKGAKKFFNIGATSKLQVVLQTSAVVPLTIVTSTATTAAQLRITLDNVFLSCTYVDIGMDGYKLLNKGGLQYYDATTFRVSSATLPASSGAVSLLTGIRGSSVKALWARFTEASTLSTAGCINYVYDSKMPQATSIAYNVNGVLNPPNPIDLLHAPATAFSLLQESNGSFNNYEFKSGITPTNYLIYVPGGTLDTTADQNILGAVSDSASTACFHFGVNLEKISKYGILDGSNLNSGNTFLNMNLGNTNTNTLTVFFIAKMDIIYIHDTASGEISVRL